MDDLFGYEEILSDNEENIEQQRGEEADFEFRMEDFSIPENILKGNENDEALKNIVQKDVKILNQIVFCAYQAMIDVCNLLNSIKKNSVQTKNNSVYKQVFFPYASVYLAKSHRSNFEMLNKGSKKTTEKNKTADPTNQVTKEQWRSIQGKLNNLIANRNFEKAIKTINELFENSTQILSPQQQSEVYSNLAFIHQINNNQKDFINSLVKSAEVKKGDSFLWFKAANELVLLEKSDTEPDTIFTNTKITTSSFCFEKSIKCASVYLPSLWRFACYSYKSGNYYTLATILIRLLRLIDPVHHTVLYEILFNTLNVFFVMNYGKQLVGFLQGLFTHLSSMPMNDKVFGLYLDLLLQREQYKQAVEHTAYFYRIAFINDYLALVKAEKSKKKVSVDKVLLFDQIFCKMSEAEKQDCYTVILKLEKGVFLCLLKSIFVLYNVQVENSLMSFFKTCLLEYLLISEMSFDVFNLTTILTSNLNYFKLKTKNLEFACANNSLLVIDGLLVKNNDANFIEEHLIDILCMLFRSREFELLIVILEKAISRSDVIRMESGALLYQSVLILFYSAILLVNENYSDEKYKKVIKPVLEAFVLFTKEVSPNNESAIVCLPVCVTPFIETDDKNAVLKMFNSISVPFLKKYIEICLHDNFDFNHVNMTVFNLTVNFIAIFFRTNKLNASNQLFAWLENFLLFLLFYTNESDKQIFFYSTPSMLNRLVQILNSSRKEKDMLLDFLKFIDRFYVDRMSIDFAGPFLLICCSFFANNNNHESAFLMIENFCSWRQGVDEFVNKSYYLCYMCHLVYHYSVRFPNSSAVIDTYIKSVFEKMLANREYFKSDDGYKSFVLGQINFFLGRHSKAYGFFLSSINKICEEKNIALEEIGPANFSNSELLFMAGVSEINTAVQRASVGIAYTMLQSFVLMNKYLEIASARKSREEQVVAHYNMGVYYHKLRIFNYAVLSFKEALRLMEGLAGFEDLAVSAGYSLAVIYSKNRETVDLARHYFESYC